MLPWINFSQGINSPCLQFFRCHPEYACLLSHDLNFPQPCTEASILRSSLLDSDLGLFWWGLARPAVLGSHQLPQLWASGSCCSLETNKFQFFKSWRWFLSPSVQKPLASLPLPFCLAPSLARPARWNSVGHSSLLLVSTVPLILASLQKLFIYEGWKQLWESLLYIETA